jgi:putative colanic acid biosynthesis UDP-glucose lipid carrier transferase
MNLKGDLPILGSVDSLQHLYGQCVFQEIIVALPLTCEEKIQNILLVADYNGTRVRLIPDFYRLVKCKYTIDTKDEIPFLNVHQVPLDNFNLQICKRIFDIIFSFVILILIAPILIMVAIAIRIDSKGPLFYKPVRMGKAGKEFTLFKFRSMSVSDPATSGANSTQKDDARITRVGRFIRKYSIDELPQFLNVLLGDMSIVGPRPHRIWLNKDLQSKVQGYMMRQYVKPGITGWAQVNGWRGPTETRVQRYGRTLHDLWYIENWFFFLDVWIIFLTIFGVKTRKNAF